MPSSAFAAPSLSPDKHASKSPASKSPASRRERHGRRKNRGFFGFGSFRSKRSTEEDEEQAADIQSSAPPPRRGVRKISIIGRLFRRRVAPEPPRAAEPEPAKLNPHDQMKASLEALDAQQATLQRQMSVTGHAINDAAQGVDRLRECVGIMLEELRMELRKPAWQEAIGAVGDFASCKSIEALRETARDAAATTLVPLASEVLAQLHKGEPTAEPHAAALLVRTLVQKRGAAVGEPPTEALAVISATAAIGAQSLRAKMGAVWSAVSANPLAVEAFHVLRTGEAVLRSPYGTDGEALSMAPLKMRDGRPFGVVISGKPAAPDDFVRGMAVAAGPLLELVWKSPPRRLEPTTSAPA